MLWSGKQHEPNAAGPTPGDANLWLSGHDSQGADKFERALNGALWKDLTGRGQTDPLTPMSVGQPDIESEAGQRTLQNVRESVESGYPVVLGLNGHTSSQGFPRHTLLVVGYKPGVEGPEGLIVRDNWRIDSSGSPVSYATLAELLAEQGHDGSQPPSPQEVHPASRATLAETLAEYDDDQGRYTTIDSAMQVQARDALAPSEGNAD